MTAETPAGLPLGSAIVLGGLLWGALRIGVALIEARAWSRRAGRVDEVLHHIDKVAMVGLDLFGEVELLAKDVAAIRDAVEQLGDPHGGAR